MLLRLLLLLLLLLPPLFELNRDLTIGGGASMLVCAHSGQSRFMWVFVNFDGIAIVMLPSSSLIACVLGVTG